MLIVSDTSPVINLAVIDQLDLLPKLFREIIIPQAVYDEIVTKGAGLPGSKEVASAHWIIKKSCSNQKLLAMLLTELDPGEAEAIALAVELNADYLLIDEILGRAKAQSYQLKPLGVLGILLRAKSVGLIASVKDSMDDLRSKANFFIHSNLYNHILALAGE